ncbi:MAG: zinc ribbon domain-containing protein [Acidimicrobiales bacterium]|nr:zinc ribbon domain-containing protein [Acidimicrobiales bacterium]
MSANFCTECGTHFDPEQHFCPNCGHPRTGDGDATAPTASTPPPAPAPPPPMAPAPPPAAAAPGGGNRPWWIALGVLGVLTVIGVIAAVLLWPGDDEAGASEVFLIAEDAAGPDAFTEDIPVENPTTTSTTTTTAATTTSGATAAIPARAGGSPGLYGGTRSVARCDPAQVADFLADNPDKAQAWVDALNADPTLTWSGGSRVAVSEIDDYLDELTPVTLTTDTRVTNHGYENGRPTTIPAVLQAGTAVLVDAWGTPRVKCNCGNPLTAATPITSGRTYRGTPWATWEPTRVTVIQQTTVEIDVYVLVNLSGDGYIDRPVGTTGDLDTESDYDPSAGSSTTTTAPPTTAAPTTEAPAEPSGDFCTLAARWVDDYYVWLQSATPESVPDSSGLIAQLDDMAAVAPNDLIADQLRQAQDWLRDPLALDAPELPDLEAYLNDPCGIVTDRDLGGN